MDDPGDDVHGCWGSLWAQGYGQVRAELEVKTWQAPLSGPTGRLRALAGGAVV